MGVGRGAGEARRHASSLMSAGKEQAGRRERIRLLATQNRRRRERASLSAGVGKITGRAHAEDEFRVAEADPSSGGAVDGEVFERRLPDDYPERNQHLFARFGGLLPERNVVLHVRLIDLWCVSLGSEVAFSHLLEFAELGRSFSRYSGRTFYAAAPDSGCDFDLRWHRYYHFANNRWECYEKLWQLSVSGRRWCEIARRVFAPDPEA